MSTTGQLRAFRKFPPRELSAFKRQLTYLGQRFTFVSVSDCLASLDGERVLPPAACLLTFDDGYAEHFSKVFPILDREGIPAVFFPPARAILRRELLEVHKIHFLIARTASAEALDVALARAWHAVDGDPQALAVALAPHPNARFDSGRMAQIKTFLQRSQPAARRSALVDRMFADLVDEDPRALAETLYLSLEELSCMQRHGMTIGGHGWDHPWWDLLSEAEQRSELDGTRELLAALDGAKNFSTSAWAFAYPFGSFNAQSDRLLREAGCRLAFTTEPRVATLEPTSALKLPRLDTNDFPS